MATLGDDNPRAGSVPPGPSSTAAGLDNAVLVRAASESAYQSLESFNGPQGEVMLRLQWKDLEPLLEPQDEPQAKFQETPRQKAHETTGDNTEETHPDGTHEAPRDGPLDLFEAITPLEGPAPAQTAPETEVWQEPAPLTAVKREPEDSDEEMAPPPGPTDESLPGNHSPSGMNEGLSPPTDTSKRKFGQVLTREPLPDDMDGDPSELDPDEQREDLNDRLAILKVNIGKLQRKKGKRVLSTPETATLREFLETQDRLQQQLTLFDRPRSPWTGKTRGANPDDRHAGDGGMGLARDLGRELPRGCVSTVAAPSPTTKPGTRTRTKRAKATEKQRRGPKKKKAEVQAASDQATKILADFLTVQDPLQTRAAMGDIPAEPAFQAKTIGEQAKKFRERAEKYTDAEKRMFKDDEAALKRARLIMGKGCAKADGERWLLKGMKTSLLHHQLIGAAWMKKRERTLTTPHGGILADAMGFGKTVDALATIVSHPPTETDKKSYQPTTLIVAPSNLLVQWGDEIQKHAQDLASLSFTRLSGPQAYQLNALKKAETILVSYNMLSSCHAAKLKAEKQNPSVELPWIYATNFYRIILDEAHTIKNHNSQAARACFDLKGKFRWVVTGTPALNAETELFPYFKFLGVDGCSNLGTFKKAFCSGLEAVTPGERVLHKLLLDIMLRRSYANRFMNQPPFVIPHSHPLPPKLVTFSEEEGLIQKVVAAHFWGKVNDLRGKEDEAQEVQENQTTEAQMIAAGIMRLRQIIDHPFLLEALVEKESIFTPSTITALREGLKGAEQPTPILDMIECHCMAKRKYSPAGSQAPSETISATPGSDGAGTQAESGERGDRSVPFVELLCPFCFKIETGTGQRAECGHYFCRSCLDQHLAFKLYQKVDNPPCPRCDKPLGQIQNFEVLPLFRDKVLGSQPTSRQESSTPRDATQSFSPSSSTGGAPDKQRRRGEDFHHFQPRDGQGRDFFRESDNNPNASLLMSAKLKGVCEIVEEWQQTAPDDKIIIFVDFIAMGKIVGRKLQDMPNLDFVYYFGSMSTAGKAKSLDAFEKKREVKVMIMGLKCGGLGLNLTCANRVIIVDLWWNLAMESQAYGRVFRISQEKETYFIRVIVQGSIDELVMQMQDRKILELKGTDQEFNPSTQLVSEADLKTLLESLAKDDAANHDASGKFDEKDESGDGGDNDSDGDDIDRHP